eukprot:TRINITY_DN2665_c0_g1_i2.p1 TRINITY_DN2665_c0_g1~~TRINITY_DN2665_c0_g1_i2.p1  ORF type:complete len:324 (+),score=56.98 TRINITY_DN2665_c0_g1_i2:37-972(+)
MNWKIVVPVVAVVLGVIGCVVWWLAPEVIDARVELLPNHPANWDENEVAVWLNSTVKYPEYHGVFKAHAIDGPTLFYLTESDLAYLKITNPVHRAKFLAHLDLLRGKCLCTPQTQSDFWDYARKHSYKVLYLGAMFEWSPRLAFLYTAVFSSETLAAALAPYGGETYPTIVYTVVSLLFMGAPHVALIALSTALLLPANYVLFLSYLLSHYNKLIVDFVELKELIPELKERRTFQMWYNLLFNMRASRTKWLKETLYPILFIVVGPFLPHLVTQIVLYLYFGSHIFYYIVFLIDIGAKYIQKFTGEGEQSS